MFLVTKDRVLLSVNTYFIVPGRYPNSFLNALEKLLKFEKPML
jgi:hypothetical protein